MPPGTPGILANLRLRSSQFPPLSPHNKVSLSSPAVADGCGERSLSRFAIIIGKRNGDFGFPGRGPITVSGDKDEWARRNLAPIGAQTSF
jgi:hypothetical protein